MAPRYACFTHRECEYFPCHPGAEPDNFNCLFCYCPLYPLGAACGGAVIYRKAVLERIGYLDEAHFAYLEDIDIGYRARIYGYRNMFCPAAQVFHVGSGTSGSKYNAFKVKLSARNNLYVNYKNMPLPILILNFLPLLSGYLVKYVFFLKIGWGKEYKEGIQEGIRTMRSQKKVPFRIRHLPNYIRIEAQLIRHTFSYARDWFTRKICRK